MRMACRYSWSISGGGSVSKSMGAGRIKNTGLAPRALNFLARALRILM